MTRLKDILKERRLLLDGGMGTLIQEYKLQETDFRGEQFKDWKVLLKGNNDVLVLTRPDVISEIHRRYLEAGADFICTNTFSFQRVSQSEYHLEEYVEQMCRAGVRLAKAEAERMTALTPQQPRFVLGDVGPTSRMLSMSEDVNNPADRSITFDELEAAFAEQISCYVDEGVDAILAETIFDTLNAKAIISAYEKVLEAKGKSKDDVPLMLSMTVSDNSGRTLSGQTVEAFVASVMHASPLSVGMNCGLGADDMVPYLRRMRDVAPCFVTCHPNAGLPNQFGVYDQTPEDMVEQIKPLLLDGVVDIIGGCCGTTPGHIKAMRALIDEMSKGACNKASEEVYNKETETASSGKFTISGLESCNYTKEDFVVVGERCNVAGSRKFLRLINEKNYDEALDIARKQLDKGAMVIDINMDDGLLDAKTEMRTFINLLMADPSISRVPIMVDSSRFEVIEEGLKCTQGKCIVNSISLKHGEEEFLRQARIVKRLGAAVIVMCFDEEGQANDHDRRVAISSRAYRLLVDEVGFNPYDIIFDPNVLTIATGMAEHANYARDFISATRWITTNLPGARVSGGLSNLSFAFRGNNYLREAMHSVFLHYAREAGMNMAIMNPATAVRYENIPEDLRNVLAAVILNEKLVIDGVEVDANERLMEMAQEIQAQQQREKELKAQANSASASTNNSAPTNININNDTPEERLREALVKGTDNTLESDLKELLSRNLSPLEIISGPLMEGMNKVGQLFCEGRMFLPQVIKTARTMKKAVDILDPYMKENQIQGADKAVGRIIIATVKGDVHDIGKNIVGVVLACNGFEVIDLGVMVPAETIVREAIDKKADIVCLSGLITPSLEEMCNVAKAMQEANLRIPLFVGGATTSLVHTAVKISSLYNGGVFHMRDAAQDPIVAMQLLDPVQRDAALERNRQEHQRVILAQQRKELRINVEQQKAMSRGLLSPVQRRFSCDWDTYSPAQPPFLGQKLHTSIPVSKLIPLIDWMYFFWAWRVKEDTADGKMLREDADGLLAELAASSDYDLRAITAFYPAKGTETAIKVKLRKNDHEPQCPCCNEELSIPTPRQSLTTATGKHREQCLSLCDFISPRGDDYVGAFAATVSEAFVSRLEALKDKGDDDYASILLQTIGDRLVEAASEYLSRELEASNNWGGIRPAVGYPSLPDQKTIHLLKRMLDYDSVGISITDNGAMYPQASVSGLYISNPDSMYFNVL